MTEPHTDHCTFSWPPANQPPETGYLKFFRTSYDLDISDSASEDTVTVVVGEKSNISTFRLPKSALRASSEFFARALKPAWSASSARIIHLPDVNVALFHLYARWLASGAEVMTEEDDWKAEYTEYLKWRLELEDQREKKKKNKTKFMCPVTVWDFELTTQAWFLGDYLQSADFQNHCIGHLFYMHLQIDHHSSVDWYDSDKNDWRWGTVAFVRPKDVLHTWEKTDHLALETSFQSEQHPLRRFFVKWLAQFWDAYSIADWDHEAQDGLVQMIEMCPDLAYKQLRQLTCIKGWRENIKGIEAYHV
jgi:hypothetical protein